MSNKGKIISTKEFTPQKEQSMLLDTNILIKILYPLDFEGRCEEYAILLEKTKSVGCRLIISSVQISEFINRCIRTQFKLYQKTNQECIDFKRDYRNTNDYRENMNAILDIVTGDISPNFEFVDDDFSRINPDMIFRYGFSYDFNDSLLVEIAKMQEATIVTDDSDFGNFCGDIQIVTNNSKLLLFR